MFGLSKVIVEVVMIKGLTLYFIGIGPLVDWLEGERRWTRCHGSEDSINRV